MPMHDPEHPGTVLKTLYLDPLGLTVTEAAKGLCVTRQSLSNIINSHTAITPDMALRLEKAFGHVSTDVAHDAAAIRSVAG